jgi:hypothetical protein
MNLGKVFVQSLIREVGRGGGKVVSNKIYGSSHSTPVRVIHAVEEHTSPIFSGTRRKYRHELDKILNGDLPGSKVSVKKSLVSLEDSLNELFNNNSNPESLFAWLDKTHKFVEKVQKIASDESITVLASEVNDQVASYRGALVEGIEVLEIPEEPKKSATQNLFFILGLILLVSSIGITFWAMSQSTNDVPDDKEYLVTLVFLVGVVSVVIYGNLSSKFNTRLKQYKNIKANIGDLKELANSMK